MLGTILIILLILVLIGGVGRGVYTGVGLVGDALGIFLVILFVLLLFGAVGSFTVFPHYGW